MKGKFYFLTAIIITILFNISYGQLDYSVVDDFNRTDNNTLGTTSSTFSTWIENEETDSVDQLQVLSNALFVSTSGVTGIEPTNASINFSNELDSADLGVDELGWSFHMDLNTTPTGWDLNNYSLGWVLAANENDFSSATVDGYAVIWTATSQELVLIKFQDGISGSDPGTQIINTGLFYGDAGTDGVNVRVEVDASGNWTMYWETGTALSNALSIDANTATSASTHTDYFDDANLVYTGPVWAHSNDAGAGFDGTFNNFNLAGVKSDLSLSGLTLNAGAVIADTSVIVNFDINNTGNLNASANTIRTFLSTDNLIDGGDTELNSISLSTLDAGDTRSIIETVYFPKNTSTGTYYIILMVDGYNVLRESDESNNTSSDQKGIAIAASLTITNIGANSVDLSWTGSGADNYLILYYETGTNDYQYASSLVSPKTISVAPSTDYTLKMKTYYNGQWSAYTNTVSFTSLAGSQLIADNVSIGNITSNSADVSWDGSGADNYLILYYETGTNNYQYASSTTSPTTISVFPSTNYTVKMKTNNAGQWSNYTSAITFTSSAGSQIIADNVAVGNITSNSADVSWDGTGADNYIVLYYETGTNNYQYASSTTSPTTISLFPSTNYTLKMRTYDNGQWSSYTSDITFSSIAGSQIIADNVAVGNITGNSADVSWDGSGADNYLILYYETGTSNYQYATSTTSPTTISALPSTDYTLKMKTYDNGKWTSYTKTITFSTPAAAPPATPNSANNTSYSYEPGELFMEPEKQIGTIYPNPARDVINIDVLLDEPGEVMISIYDLNGRLIQKFEEKGIQNQTLQYNIETIKSGIYIIKLKTGNSEESRKLIVR